MRYTLSRLASLAVLNRTVDREEILTSCSAKPPPTDQLVPQRSCQCFESKTMADAWKRTMIYLSIHTRALFAVRYSSCSFNAFPLVPLGNGPRTKASTNDTESNYPPEASYDFVILGCGNAGMSALQAIRTSCPNAKIAVVDPSAGRSDVATRFKADFWYGRAVSLNQDRTVEVETSRNSLLSYRHAVLVATGSRGAPPPYYLIDEQCEDSDVLELRSTSYAASGNIMHSKEYVYGEAVAGRDKVCILGSGWEAMELTARTTLSRQRQNRPCLVMGCHGPVSRVLPSYLSSAVSKRFRSKGVEVAGRSLVRYISRTNDGKIQIYTAKAYDFLDGNALICDKVIIAPEVEGSRGTAMLPTDEVPEFLLGSTNGRPWYQSWAHLSPPTVTCYHDDGRILVNAELCAATDVFAAGSVAKFPNYRTGNAAVAGFGIHDGSQAGMVAGNNMARQFWKSKSPSSTVISPLVKESIPVWSSDAIFPDDESVLQRIGVQALCVGNCESESLSTHGIWWTNQAAQRRLLDSFQDDATDPAIRKQVKGSFKAVYGLGFVFYLDGKGRIHGVMAWGLPYRTGNANTLNAKLIGRMKKIIVSNGGFRRLETEQDFIRMNRYLEEQAKEMTLLALSASALHDSKNKMHRLGSTVSEMPRPLHRYTEIRPARLRSLGYHRAKDGRAHSIMGENLFSREENDDIPDAPVPEPDMKRNVGSATAKVKAWYDWNIWLQSELRWEHNESRARPPKEDPLWIRKGDETRNITEKDRLASAYNTILGGSSNGG